MFAKTQVAIIYNLSFLSDKKLLKLGKNFEIILKGGRRFNTPFNLDSINVKSYRLQILQIFAILSFVHISSPIYFDLLCLL